MFEGIVAGIVVSVSEALCIEIIKESKKREITRDIIEVTRDTFRKFCNTSIDSLNFKKMLYESHFKEMLKNYYYNLYDKSHCKLYHDCFIKYIKSQCPDATEKDINSFLLMMSNSFHDVYIKIIEKNDVTNALYKALTLSHRDIINKISNIEITLQNYIKSIDRKNFHIDDAEILEFHSVCHKDFSYIQFSGISGAEGKNSLKLDDFYVQNTFSFFDRTQEHTYKINKLESNIEINKFFTFENKIILLGGAGLGKSTSLNYIYCNYEKLFSANALKFKLDLKEYAPIIISEAKGIFGCLCNEFYRRSKRSKISYEEIEIAISNYLEQGKCLVILDAIDEIAVQSIRNKVRDEIATFCNMFYLNRVIISSRETGYLRNKFNDNFLHIKINNFSNAQIEKYSSNWVKINYADLNFDDFWSKFNKEIEKSKCRELIRNPIILILALVIFDIEKNLPNRKIEFYKKCIETFLRFREQLKDVFNICGETKSILRGALTLPKIAYFKHDRMDKNIEYKFTKEEIEKAVRHAIEIEDDIRWNVAIHEYIQYLVERTEIICEINEDIYDFAHKTFYEYFLAIYYSKVYSGKDLKILLAQWIGDSNFDELARLIIEVTIENRDSQKDDELINFLFDGINSNNNSVAEEKQIQQAINYLSILSLLYNGDILPSKFYSKYDECIIQNANLLKYRNTEGQQQNLAYNTQNIINSFIVNFDANFNFIFKALKSVYFLDDVYCNTLSSKYDIINKICIVCEAIKENDKNLTDYGIKKNKLQKAFESAQYLIKEKCNIVKKSPELFLFIIEIYQRTKRKLDFEKIIDIQFDKNAFFSDFCTSETPYIALRCMYSPLEFLIFQICFVYCAKPDVFMLGCLCNSNHKRFQSDFIIQKTFRNVSFLFYVLNSKSLQIYTKYLIEHEIYNENFYDIYKMIYESYHNNKTTHIHKEIIGRAERLGFYPSTFSANSLNK